MVIEITPEMREKANETRRRSKEILKKYGYEPTMPKAVRANCRDCQGAGNQRVKNCGEIGCALWPFRMGRPPRDKDLMVAQISREGNVAGHIHLDQLAQDGQEG